MEIRKMLGKFSGITPYIIKVGTKYFKIGAVSQLTIQKLIGKYPSFKKFFL